MKILLCPPDHFSIQYEINPWMHVQNQVDPSTVQHSYAQLKQTYLSLGIELAYIAPEKGWPDMVYPANYGVIKGNTFIASNYKFPERQGEKQIAINYFTSKGYDVKTLPETIHFEGEGDLLPSDDTYFLGWGKRSDPAAKPYLEEYLQSKIIDLELVNPYYYHLDTCFAPLGHSRVLINPASFTPTSLRKVHDFFDFVIETNVQDNSVIACNLVLHNQHIVTGKGISDSLKERLSQLGFTVLEIPMAEYIKGGGSVKCCSLIIE